jgi:hypothetical protein
MSNTTLVHVGLAFAGIAAVFLIMERILMGPAPPRPRQPPRQRASGFKLRIVILLAVTIGVLTAVSL